MNPIERQNKFRQAMRYDDHFAVEEEQCFAKVLYRKAKKWEVWSVMSKGLFDRLLEEALQDSKARFLNKLINNDMVDIR